MNYPFILKSHEYDDPLIFSTPGKYSIDSAIYLLMVLESEFDCEVGVEDWKNIGTGFIVEKGVKVSYQNINFEIICSYEDIIIKRISGNKDIYFEIGNDIKNIGCRIIKIQDSNEYGFLKLDVLERFEKSLGCKLPKDYRNFLIDHNGGTPEKYLVCWPGSTEPSEVWNNSLGLHDGPTYARLDLMTKELTDYLPYGVIPFACDPGGNYFCIGIAGEYVDKIYFWNHERSEGGTSIDYLNESFTKFVAGLIAEEEE
jgi:hypothetical protein